jgi:hypothetical protein
MGAAAALIAALGATLILFARRRRPTLASPVSPVAVEEVEAWTQYQGRSDASPAERDRWINALAAVDKAGDSVLRQWRSLHRR